MEPIPDSVGESEPSVPTTLGPYRLLRRLGRGGMGEVFEAIDERLDRRVAIKRLSLAARDPSQSRKRLRQEARTAARLNHPCLVQIYDLLEEGGADYLVLELVEGRSLRQRLTDGPLEAPELLRLALELSAGLLHAHERGIIHRDLKPANVLLTRSGQAKIADFGIAKNRFREGEDLTQGEVRVGTYRNMSPEQARGEMLDHRSDLFSLGLLLYEAATGSNPFSDADPLATLRNISREEAPPLNSLRPDLPGPFVGLIHRLLSKARELRPQSAGEVTRELSRLMPPAEGSVTLVDGGPPPSEATVPEPVPAEIRQKRRSRAARAWIPALAVVAVLAGTFLTLLPERASPAPRTLAVPMPRGEVGAEGEVTDLVPGAVRFALLSALTELEGIHVLAAPEVDRWGTSPAAVARTTQADEVLDSELDCRGRRCWVTLSRIADGGQRLVWTERLEAPADNLYVLSQAVAGFLRQGYPELRRRPGPPPLEVRPRDYEEFLRLERALHQKEEGAEEETVLARLAALRGTSPRFLEGYLLAAEIQRLRFVATRDADLLEEAFALLEEARRIAPRHPRPLYFLFSAALAGGRMELAAQTLRDLEEIDPGAAQIGAQKAHLLEARGEGLAALEEMRRVTAERPSVLNLSNLADKEYLLGRVKESRGHLLQALDLAPKDHTLRSRLASLELLAGDPARAVSLYTELVQKNPGFVELSNLGLALLLEGRFGEARQQFQGASELAPKNVFAMLNLADSRWLAGDREGARELYEGLLHVLEADPAASGWQFLTVKAQALAHLGRSEEAAAAVTEARRRAPDNPQVAYESALVLALNGDLPAARGEAHRALDLGYAPRWFSFPWFDPLHLDADPRVVSRGEEENPS